MLKQTYRFLNHGVRSFMRHHNTSRAAALAFTSALAIVPLFSIIVSMLSKFSVSDEMINKIQALIIENFVPQQSERIIGHIQAITHHAASLPVAEFVFLIVLTFLLFNSISHALNHIWHVEFPRRLYKRIVICAVLLVAIPLLLGLSVTISSYLFSLQIASQFTWLPTAKYYMFMLLPFACSFVAFTSLYYFVPNCHVMFRNAACGGLFTMIVFELSKKIFSIYLTAFPAYDNLYGALAIIPIFLIWLYLFWLMVLIGCKVSHDLQYYKS